MIESSNKQRIDNMMFETNRAICSHCGDQVYPKFVDYRTCNYANKQSNMLWCNNCYKGETRIFWRYID